MAWRILNLMLAPGMSLTTWVLFTLDKNVGQLTQSEYGEALIVPSGYAFSIWGLIYAASIVYGVYQSLPATRDDPMLRRIRPWTALAFLLTSAWLLAAMLEWIWGTFAILLALFLALGAAMRQATRLRTDLAAERWLVRAPLGLFWGWATAAMFANLAAAMKYYGLFAGMLWEPGWTVALLALATTIACWATFELRGNLAYPAAVLWAFVAILHANWVADQNTLIAAATAAGATVLVALAGWRYRQVAA